MIKRTRNVEHETRNTKQNTMKKKKYIAPRIEWIPLDSDISLALASDPAPPAGPGEGAINAPLHFNNDPYKTMV
jgi:hypothetical protein